jgi:hypothetical protein
VGIGYRAINGRGRRDGVGRCRFHDQPHWPRLLRSLGVASTSRINETLDGPFDRRYPGLVMEKGGVAIREASMPSTGAVSMGRWLTGFLCLITAPIPRAWCGAGDEAALRALAWRQRNRLRQRPWTSTKLNDQIETGA